MRRMDFYGAVLAAAVAMLVIAAPAVAVELASPGGTVVVTVEVKADGGKKDCLLYGVRFHGKAVIAPSPLGFAFKNHPVLESGLRIVRSATSSHDETWKPVCGERSQIRDHYNQLMVDLQDGQARKLQVTFRAYDEGAALCYTIPAQDSLKSFVITQEKTQFRFTGDHTTWPVYAAQGDYSGGKHGTGPAVLSKLRPGAERPLTVRVADDVYAAIAEAKLVEYARMKFRPVEGVPHAVEASLDGEVTATAPMTTPWRVIMTAATPGKLLEQNYLILNLNDPCALADTRWIKPGKVIREVTLTTEGGKACIDFAAARGLQYIEFDAGWYGRETDDASDARAVNPARKKYVSDRVLNLQEVIDYGQAKGIGVILYVNRRALERQLDEILPLYAQWGVKGVKYGFVNVGSQKWTSWLHGAIRKAAQHKLMVDIHDEFRSTGYQRTYPNLVTVEGILGNEGFPNSMHSNILPFTRFLAGPADYTFCWYNERLKNTHGHQLAISTIFFSPFQFLYWYDRPSDYDGEAALDYWKELPTVWDDTRVVLGEIGQVAAVARRSGEVWFLGAIHAGGRGTFDIPLAFLDKGKPYVATVYRDANPDDPASKAVKIETIPVDAGAVLKADMPANGGMAARIVPKGK